MPAHQHQGVRTTLTLDEDLAAKLKAEARKTGRPFKETVNACLRAGLSMRKPAQKARPFQVRPHDMGIQPGVSFDKVSALLDQIEGVERR
jgi:hypothetical protein